MNKKFSKVGEKKVTRVIVCEFINQFIEYVESDCVITKTGLSGLMIGRNLVRMGGYSGYGVNEKTYHITWVGMIDTGIVN